MTITITQSHCPICGCKVMAEAEDEEPLCYLCGVCEASRIEAGYDPTPRYYRIAQQAKVN
jgi:ribosomal protein S27AE